ncbi:MAG: (2Fe-2S)-binding protein [Deltaproteobacteria bacterium]|nr:(2Fe-2S)-binding protein [Deltaproteobacteria bacterium]
MTTSRLDPSPDSEVTITLDGETITARPGEPLAAALMGAGVQVIGRSSKYHRVRGAPCGRGHCHQCLCRVDGQPNRQACQTPVSEGMVVERQNALGSAENDLLAATDWLFPRGLDHHAMFTGMPLIQPVVQKVVRKLSGLGHLPGALPAAEGLPPLLDQGPEGVEVLVIGGGNAGIAAARAIQGAGARPLLVEALPELGGRLRSPLHEDEPRTTLPGLRVRTGTSAEWISGPGHPLEVVVRQAQRLQRILPRAVVLATGNYVGLSRFENNDLPGLFDARWAAELVARWGVLPGRKVLLCAMDELTDRLRALLEEAGASIVATLPAEAALGRGETRVLGVNGRHWVEQVVLATPEGEKRLACDALIHSLPGHPCLELFHAAGGQPGWSDERSAFEARVAPDGSTPRPGVFAAGSMTARMSPAEASESGARAGSAAAAFALSRPPEHDHAG